MATLYGVNSTLRGDDGSEPTSKIDVTQNYGKVRCLYDTYELAAVLASGDTINLMKIPKGARLLGAEFSADDLGTAGTVTVGWAAGADGDEAADADGILGAQDASSAISRAQMAFTDAGYNKQFSEEVQVQLACTVASELAAGTLALLLYIAVE